MTNTSDTKPGINVGDIVKLRSGGPNMTVTKVTDDQKCECRWFSGEFGSWEGHTSHDTFPLLTLDLVEI